MCMWEFIVNSLFFAFSLTMLITEHSAHSLQQHFVVQGYKLCFEKTGNMVFLLMILYRWYLTHLCYLFNLRCIYSNTLMTSICCYMHSEQWLHKKLFLYSVLSSSMNPVFWKRQLLTCKSIFIYLNVCTKI